MIFLKYLDLYWPLFCIAKTVNKQENDTKDIVFNSTYDVVVGANNENKVNVVQFFENHTDAKHLKLLSKCLESLKDETEYLREQVRTFEQDITDRKKKFESMVTN